MENRATKTMTQGDGLLLGKPAVPAGVHVVYLSYCWWHTDHYMFHCSASQPQQWTACEQLFFCWCPMRDFFGANFSHSVQPRWGLEATLSFSNTRRWFCILTATDEESHKVLYEAVSANVMSANFDVVHGDDYEYLPSSNPPAASPPGELFDALRHVCYWLYIQPNAHQLTSWLGHTTHKRNTLHSALSVVIGTGTRIIRHGARLNSSNANRNR